MGQFCPYGSLVRMFAVVRIADPNAPEANSAGGPWVISTIAPGIRSAEFRRPRLGLGRPSDFRAGLRGPFAKVAWEGKISLNPCHSPHMFTLSSMRGDGRGACRMSGIGYRGSALVVFRRAAKGWQARLRQGYGAQPSLFGLPAEASAKAGKMSTFAHGKKPVRSRR
jgi:hypothetical protein